MRCLISLSLILFWNLSISQDCSTAIKITDDFTGIEKVSVPMVTVYNDDPEDQPELINFALDRTDTVSTLLVTYQKKHYRNDLGDYCFNKDSKIIFKLDGGSLVELPFYLDEVCSNSKVNNSGYKNSLDHTLMGSFLIDDQAIQLLKNYSLEKVRLHFKNEMIDRVIDKKTSKPSGGFKSAPGKKIDLREFFTTYINCIK